MLSDPRSRHRLLQPEIHCHRDAAEVRRAGDIRMFTRSDMGWIWLIPLSDTVTSVGAVIPQAVHRRESKAIPEDSLAHYLSGTAGLAGLLAQARRVSPARLSSISPVRKNSSFGR